MWWGVIVDINVGFVVFLIKCFGSCGLRVCVDFIIFRGSDVLEIKIV